MLLRKMKSNIYGLNMVQFAMQEIAHLNGILSIRKLSEKIGVSQKHLIAQFHKMIGASPKVFSRIVKFNQVLNAIDPSQPLNWAEIAYQCNYYDQAHFNKDFMAFSGLNPTAYVKLRRENLGQDIKKGEDVNFVPIG